MRFANHCILFFILNNVPTFLELGLYRGVNVHHHHHHCLLEPQNTEEEEKQQCDVC